MTVTVDPALVLGTCLKEIDGMTETEKALEIEFLGLRQQWINDLCAGRVSASEVLEVIEYTGISPEDYVDAVEQNIEALEKGRVELNDQPMVLTPKNSPRYFY